MPTPPIESLAEVLGRQPIEVRQIPWGDSDSTYRVVTADEAVLAARLLRGSHAAARADDLVQRAEILHREGVPVAHPMASRHGRAGSAWVLAPWVDGVTGAEMLADPHAAVRLAVAMGRLRRRLGAVDGAGLPVDEAWSDRERFAASLDGWIEALGDGPDPVVSDQVGRDAALVEAGWGRGPGWAPGVVHGDFVPINVVSRLDGSITLLDLDRVALGPALVDVAWWGWVVRLHHPDAWRAAGPSFVTAAGLSIGPGLEAMSAAIARLLVLGRAAAAEDAAVRATWLARLVETVGW